MLLLNIDCGIVHLCMPVNFFNDSYVSALIRGVKSNRDNVAMTLHKSSIKISPSAGLSNQSEAFMVVRKKWNILVDHNLTVICFLGSSKNFCGQHC